MGWFHQTLERLRALHSEVDRRLRILNKEYEELGLLVNNARIISKKLNDVKQGWDKILYLRGHIQEQAPKALQREIKRYGKEVDDLSQLLEEIDSYLRPLKLTINVLSKKEKEEEE